MTGLPNLSLSSMAYTVGHWLPRTYIRGDGQDPFDLDAPYQRGSVWTIEQRRALIKSLYMGLPVGKQRVETVRMFANGEFAIPYEWLRDEHRNAGADWVRLEVSFSQCSESFRRWFDMSAQLPSLEFKAEREWLGRSADGKGTWRNRTDDEILRVEAELYGLVNGGGTPQTADDMARAAEVAR